jgi:hypothetical protein
MASNYSSAFFGRVMDFAAFKFQFKENRCGILLNI